MSETRLCERCGTPFTAYFYEKHCHKCHLEIEREKIVQQAIDGEDIECSDNPVCPWCGFEWEPDGEDSDLYVDGDYIKTCPECEKVFSLTTSVSITYDTSRTLSEGQKRELEEREKFRRKHT